MSEQSPEPGSGHYPASPPAWPEPYPREQPTVPSYPGQQPSVPPPPTGYPVPAVPPGGAYPPPWRSQSVSSPAGMSPLFWGVLVVVLGGLLGLVAGGIGGVGVASVTSSVPGGTPSRAPQSPFPGDVRYVPGLTVQQVRQVGGGGWRCTTRSVPESSHGAGSRLFCSDSETHRANVTAYYKDETRVWEVRGFCFADTSKPSLCAAFYGDLATLVFEAGQKEAAGQARIWARANGRTEKQATIGVVDIKASRYGRMSFAGIG